MSFDRGTVCIRGGGVVRMPHARHDGRDGVMRAYGMHHREIAEYLRRGGQDFADCVPDFLPLPGALRTEGVDLRDYQEQAVRRWEESGMRGCVVLPTGAGKTAVGIKAIERAGAGALVVIH